MYSQAVISVKCPRCMYEWRDGVILEQERQCTVTQRGHHRGMGTHRLPEHILHMLILTEVEASALNCGYNV